MLQRELISSDRKINYDFIDKKVFLREIKRKYNVYSVVENKKN